MSIAYYSKVIQKGHNVTSDDPKDDPKERSKRQMLIIKEMNVNDTITIQEMTQKIKVSEKTIKLEIALLLSVENAN